jgi:hypothetical protein
MADESPATLRVIRASSRASLRIRMHLIACEKKEVIMHPPRLKKI